VYVNLLRWYAQARLFNRVLCPSYQGFRIYRETLSRFSCAASTSKSSIALKTGSGFNTIPCPPPYG
ncbi:hypothetical protein ACT6QE_09620, partial [Staphylococcus aureus]